MNEFVSWCRHLLVSFLFHALTSLHPPYFIEMIFPLVDIHTRQGAIHEKEEREKEAIKYGEMESFNNQSKTVMNITGASVTEATIFKLQQ